MARSLAIDILEKVTYEDLIQLSEDVKDWRPMDIKDMVSMIRVADVIV